MHSFSAGSWDVFSITMNQITFDSNLSKTKWGHSSFPYGLYLNLKKTHFELECPTQFKVKCRSKADNHRRLNWYQFFLSVRNKKVHVSNLRWRHTKRSCLINSRVGIETEFQNIPKLEPWELELLFAFLAANLLSNKNFIKLADSHIIVILASINSHRKIHIFSLALMGDKNDVLFFHYWDIC